MRDRPLVMLGPLSYLGCIYAPMVAQACEAVVAVVDDYSGQPTIHGVPRWSSSEFRTRSKSIGGLAAVDFSGSLLGNALFKKMADDVAFVMST